MLADYHVHTKFSDDSCYRLEDVCEHAIELGLDEICITDHVDYGVKPDVDAYRAGTSTARMEDSQPVLNVDYERYFPAIDRARKQFAGRLGIRTGMEFGVQTHTEPQFEALFERYAKRWDFIILSIHQVGNEEFWSGAFQEGRSQDEYNTRYYEELLAVVESFSRYSVLGHLDLIKRYDPAGIWPHEKSLDLVTKILTRVIADGKGIEVNTSSFRYGLPDLQPSTQILELYRELGGRILTIGSDSHKPEHLGAHISEVRNRLRSLGFTEFCTFDKMKPIFHRL